MTPPQLLAEIARLYKHLNVLPYASPEYLALEGQIRWYAEQFKRQTGVEETLWARRVNPGEVETEAPRRRCG